LVGDPPTEREEAEMSETEEAAETVESVTCLYPGCERDAVEPPRAGGPPPRYCDDEGHNAASTYQALHGKAEDAPAEDG
jgi:hypothetical protein